jgi:DedD protein
MAEPADINVDELRRRARRRLVGAIVLALGVAVVVPMLLETEQKPLGEDVAVKIPPIDDSKFVNRLSDSRAKDGARPPAKSAPSKDDAPKTSTSTASGGASTASGGGASTASGAPGGGSASSAPGPSTAPAASEVASATAAMPATGTPSTTPSGAPAERPRYDTRIPEAVTSTPSSSASAAGHDATSTSSGKTTDAKSASSNAGAPAAAAVATAPSAPAALPAPTQAAASSPNGAKTAGAPAHDGFAVQLAAFADDKGANALAGRLKKAGYAAYTEPLKTSKGTLWRVRVGPFPSRETAVAARDKLKTEGQSGIVAALK